VFADPQVLHQEMLKTIVHPVLGELKTTGFSANLNRTPADIFKPPPLLGEHNEEILAELGYDQADMARLKEEGVI
ncbi:MAG: CoA transferase, partial [Deltaproteobacteria bacterium]|nr:CoA transferase [Deltaproteobacteria bacterium]